MAIYLSESEIDGLITMPETLDVLEEAFAARSRGEIVNRPRVRIPITAGNYNLMPAGWVAKGVVGHKVYTASAKGASFQIVIYNADGSGLLAVMGGLRISALRTGGISGVAAKHLAAATGEPVAMIGTGIQARAQVLGVLAATGAPEIRVFSRDATKRDAFAETMTEMTRLARVPWVSGPATGGQRRDRRFWGRRSLRKRSSATISHFARLRLRLLAR